MNFSPRNQMAARRAAQRKRPDRIISILLILSLLFGNLAGFPSAAAELTSYCGKEGHVHTEECYKVAVTTEPTETEGGEETTSETTEAMEETEAAQTVIISDTPVCGKEEHTHTLKCYSNPDADVETAANWEATLPETLTGTWADDLLATVRSQVGYKESVENFIVEADGETTSGYNRYGAWYGSYTQDENQPYLPWNITFLFFSIYYSNIDDFPLEETCPDWIDSLDYYGLYRAAGEYTPAEGDLVFVDTDGDGEADRVGVASEVKDNKLIAIEGDYEGAVAEVTYDLPELTVEPETTETEGTTEIDMSVSMNALLLLSDGTEEGDEAPQPTVVGYADMAQAQADAQPESDATILGTNTPTVYFAVPIEWTNAGYTIKVYVKVGSYSEDPTHLLAMDDTGNRDSAGRKIYSYTFTETECPYGGFYELHFQAFNSNGWVSDYQAILSQWTTASTIDGKQWTPNSTVSSGSHSTDGSWGVYAPAETPDVGEVTELPPVASGKRRVFYDATLSKLSYAGDSGSKGDFGIPKANSNVIYCWADKQYTMTKLTNYTKDGHTYTDVYYVDIPSNCTTVTFASFALTSATNYGWSGESTTQLTIPSSYAQPCFYANSSDDSIYNSYDGNRRGGYWDEAFMVRDPGIVGTVVDIPQETRENAADTLYLNTTFYDYYTDFELNGKNRDTYDVNASKTTDRIYQPFRHFNQALSSYYSGVSASNPLYWGNFQNYNGDHFDEIAGTLNLYGYSNNKNKFFAENNSMWGYNGGELTNNNKDGAQATMGLVSNALTNGNLMIKTSSGSAIAPYFSKSFLEGGNSKNTVLGKVYENVSFPFTKKALKSSSNPSATGTVDYWVFDSRDTTLRLKEDSTDGYWLDSTDVNAVYGSTPDKASTEKQNFFPFNSGSQSAKSQQLNYGFATKLELKFRLTENGTVKTTNTADNEEVPIEFNFSGDDDVWIFIDGQLALDVGGGHGRVAGYLNFQNKTYHVDRVKGSSNGVEYNKEGSFEMRGANTVEHTLTMFYMERGLWESNMMITFNFPDENQLEVEKQVDTTEVNPLFTSDEVGEDVFSDQKLFTFNIKNLATHFEDVDAKGASHDPITLNVEGSEVTSYSGNTFMRGTYQEKNNALHWWAALDDTSSAYRHKRYGVLTLPDTVDITNMTKLSFYMYYDDSTGFSLSNLYLQLLDDDTASDDLVGSALTAGDNNALGCIGTSLAGKTYGSTSTAGKTWVKITLDLSLLDKGTDFDKTRVRYLRFGCNLTRNIYLWGFTFEPAAVATNPTGFITQQYDVPSYGSATTGKLENASGAVYTSSLASGTQASYVVDQNGHFALQNGEIVNFHDQFRRGSYIYLEEVLSAKEQELYDTTWTMYENDKAVTSFGTGTTTTNPTDIPDMTDVASMTVTDSRVEYYQKTDSSGKDPKNKYKDPQNPGAFLFRSYANPDSTATTTKLKVTFTNKVKVGSLTIRKENAGANSETIQNETFKFVVEFYNVGGLGLESEKITTEINLKVGQEWTITGIPLNTEYNVYELKPTNVDITLQDIITKDQQVVVGGTDKTDELNNAGAYFALYYKTTGDEWAFAKIEKSSDHVHSVNIPDNMNLESSSFYFYRMNPKYSDPLEGDDHVWNKIDAELSLQNNSRKFMVTDWNAGEWYVPEPTDGKENTTINWTAGNVLYLDTSTFTNWEMSGEKVTYLSTTYGETTAYMISGVVDNVVEGDMTTVGKDDHVTFRNIEKPTVSLWLTKKWQKEDGSDLPETSQPSSIQVQLQRSKDGETWEPYVVGDFKEYTKLELSAYNDWSFAFANLDMYVDYTAEDKVQWQYRVVELDSGGNPVVSGTITLDKKDYTVIYSAVSNTTEHPDKYTQTITNKLKSNISITVTKEWKDGKGNALTANLPTSITVCLQRTTDTGDSKTWEDVKVNVNGKEVDITLPQNNSWSYTYTELPAKSTDGKVYTYRVVELDSGAETTAVVETGSRITYGTNDYTVTYGNIENAKDSEDNAIDGKYTQTITNTLVPKVKLDITKLSAVDNNPLNGVTFKLEKQSGSDWTEVGSGATADGGKLTFTDLEPGTYQLTETKTADGYSLLKAPISIVITPNDDGSYSASVDNSNVTMTEENGHYTLATTVYNKQNLTMPATGGVNGFEFWILGGLCMMAVPLLLYTFFWFKKGGKYLRK